MPNDTAADELAKLSLKPQRCVALHQGQQCYQTVNISWRTPASGNYCVFMQGQEEPIGCWLAVAQGELRHEFVSDTSTVFQLRDVQRAEVLIESRLEVAWVYHRNARRKSHWRIF